jgi:tight adherence protein B
MRPRSTRVASVAALALALTVAAPAAGAPSGGLRLIEAGGAVFPDRSYILALGAEEPIPTPQVTVRENGQRVVNVSVVPAGVVGAEHFALVLAIDTSNSMRGEPMQRAMEAARAFAARRNPGQPLGVVFFGSTVRVALPLTIDARRIDAVLSRMPAHSEGTKIYDGVRKAIDVLTAARALSGSAVVLSDGADVGSTISRDDSARNAKDEHVRVFSVGLRSEAYDSRALALLAAATDGVYAETPDPVDLTAIFDQLGYRLANEYLLRYRSLAGPAKNVEVEITVDGFDGRAATRYETPPLPIASAPPFSRPAVERFFMSPAALLVVVLWTAVLFAAGVVAVCRPRRGTLIDRMAAFVSLPQAPGPELPQAPAKGAVLADRLTASTDRSLERTRWWGRFKEELEIAEVKASPTQIVLWTVTATLVSAWLLPLVLRTGAAVILALGVPIAVRSVLKRKLLRKRRAFAEQLPGNLEVLASALRAGHSLVGALTTVVEDAAEPSRSELRRVIADEQLGVSLEEALQVVVRRMDNRDLEQVALVAALQHEAGGNSAEVLDTVTETVRGREDVRRLVKTLTAQGRLSRWVVSLLPVGLLGFITVVNFPYVKPLFTEPAGRAMLIAATVMVVSGSLVIKRIVDIKV